MPVSKTALTWLLGVSCCMVFACSPCFAQQSGDGIALALDRGNVITVIEDGPDVESEPYSGGSGTSELETVLVRDEAGIFDAANHAALSALQFRLKSDTGIEIFVVTKSLHNLDDIQLVGFDLFKHLVREVGHYRVILILIGIDSDKGQGIVNTNIGAGVYHVLRKKDCEGLFVAQGELFSPDKIKQGVSFLCNKIRTSFVARQIADGTAEIVSVEFQPAKEPGFRFNAFTIALMAFGGVLLVLLIYGFFKTSKCPRCGSLLRTRVSIVVGTGGSDLARKTYKCFTCGYVKVRTFLPKRLMNRRKG